MLKRGNDLNTLKYSDYFNKCDKNIYKNNIYRSENHRF